MHKYVLLKASADAWVTVLIVVSAAIFLAYVIFSSLVKTVKNKYQKFTQSKDFLNELIYNRE
jgi:hypothetical protein